ncbi:ABC transporter substrate-binding protein [Streptomyces poonensis]|uniref:Peptide-binding protein n=1 Tax=Streptomyces poonensis TaxID=68255 RepID=A0A918UH09_9ACTN|nr:ABC transporter substrate-binding protein [Streptomyces poonensis]GGZ07326.1 peptide-binding protein [Streptomyces poonensis]GLJ88567.1 peptide-binding protein [Streptomyces poonensis]
MKRKTLVLPAVIGLLTPALAACGGSDGGDGGGDAIVVGTTDQVAASKKTPAPLDPAYAYDVGTWNILRQTVQTLMAQPRGEGAPEPEAAESCGFTDSGNERYACTLREGLTFANGDPVTAEDVKFSIDRARALNTDSGVSGLLSTIELVETKGDREVIFHLNGPDATLPYKLSTPVAGILNPDDYDKDKLREGFEVDGSGPYTFEAEVKNDELVSAVFTKNPDYKGILDPKNDKVELRSFDDAEMMGTALANGDIQLAARGLTSQQTDELAASSSGDIDTVEAPGLEIRYLAFNTDAAPVKSRAVRQAMAQIIDRGKLVAEVYGAQAEPLYSLVPASITGHSNSFFNKYGEPDTDKAESILSEAGITTPVKLTLHYTTDHYGTATKQEFEELKKQLDASGLFDVDIEGTPWEAFRPAQLDGEYAVYGLGWFPDFPDADNFLAPFLDKDNFLGSPYANSEIRNTLIPQSRREADRLNAAESLTEMQDEVADDVPVLPLWQGKQYLAVRDDVTGAEWALNSTSTLQLWELGHGVSG